MIFLHKYWTKVWKLRKMILELMIWQHTCEFYFIMFVPKNACFMFSWIRFCNSKFFISSKGCGFFTIDLADTTTHALAQHQVAIVAIDILEDSYMYHYSRLLDNLLCFALLILFVYHSTQNDSSNLKMIQVTCLLLVLA